MKALAIAVLNFIWPAMGAALAAYWGKKEEVAKETQTEITHGRKEVQDEVDKVVEETYQKVEAGDAAGLSDDFNSLK